MNCPKCSKSFEEEKGYGWCEYRDNCPHKYCSEDCADVTAIEDYTPACPGVYWCSICRDEFLEAAKGHKFILCNHEGNEALWTYVNPDYKDGCFVQECVNCGVWSYEFKSHTDAKSPYEGRPCGERIRPNDRDDVSHLENRKWGKADPVKTVYIFFGEMGSGKSYVGSRFAERHKFKFFEGDSVVPPRMMERVSKFKSISEDMLEEYMDVLADAIADEMANTDTLVVSQALYRDEDRKSLKLFLECSGYQVKMYWVQSRWHRNIENLLTRKDGWKWVLYWLLNKPFFQKPTHECQIWRNVHTD